MWNKLALVLGMVLVGQLVGSFPSIGEATDKGVTLKGEVLAVNHKESPKILMMQVLVRGGKEMVVGALVQDETQISKKGKSVTLDQVTKGDTILLTYEKTKQGALARTITVR